jgi:hypothetical protein
VPLGDSITDICCWRSYAWKAFETAGVASQIDFVGSMTGIQSRCSPPAGFDGNHEGHSGWQVYDIARNNIDTYMKNSAPDVVQVLLGANDINIGKRNAKTIVDSFTSLLTSMRRANANVIVIVRLTAELLTARGAGKVLTDMFG